MNKKPCGIYVHIPFCRRKCRYCDFLSAPGDSKCIREYISALKKEIAAYKEKAAEYEALTVYFGGGTPSILEPDEFEEIVYALRENFDLHNVTEFTVEVNPGTVTPEKLAAFGKCGANRLSVGIQSARDEELKLLGRIHDYEEAVECIRMAREAGFSNISVDVISALPGQTVKDYEETLDRVLGLKPKHISSYSLIIEPGTPFFKDYGENGDKKEELPDEETDREMYALTARKLAAAGYYRYEISNYALPGYESRHNSSYWKGRDYFGLGLGASSFVDGVRYSNVRDMGEYVQDPGKHIIEEVTDDAGRMAEFMILGLRMTKGISKTEFKRRFGVDVYDIYGDAIKRFIELGAMAEDGDMLKLTEYGLDVSNTVFEEFI